MPVPTKADYQAGREYGDYGMCNPAYFNMGALINYLKRLRDEEGLSVDRIVRDYVYLMAGATGPCRFGMYETQYRMALRNAGFEGFRVLAFAQGQGMNQTPRNAGLPFDHRFFLGFFNGIWTSDVLNELGHQLIPYEVEPGAAHRILGQATARMEEAMRAKWRDPGASWAMRFLGRGDPGYLVDQLTSRHYLDPLRECTAAIDDEVEVDYTRPKPVVKVVGEFWAQMTEGDGNFRMFSYLEEQGAEVVVEPLSTWPSYLLAHRRDRVLPLLRATRDAGFGERLAAFRRGAVYRMNLRVLNWMWAREYKRLRRAAGIVDSPLVSQRRLTRLSAPFCDSRFSGGEGHLEVAKTIYYTEKNLAHMVLGLKPFGCLPSTQSDGVQAAVQARYPDVIYLPIETSGEGDINAYSRVQMALFEAKERCREEFDACVAASGYTLADIRAYVRDRRDLRRPLQHVPRRKGVAGRAANFVLHVAGLMKEDGNCGAGKQGVSRGR